MQLVDSLNDIHLANCWLTIGAFDGIHLGHQQILKKLTNGAHSQDIPAVVITFYPHPGVVLGKRLSPIYLNTPIERAERLSQMGIDLVITHHFDNKVAETSAHDFIAYLVSKLHLSQLLVGTDFALGHNREGDLHVLQELSREFNFVLDVIPPVRVDDRVVSSSLIRHTLTEGDVELAGRLLGHPYQISGVVVVGEGRGKSLGIPTANLQIWPHLVIPKAGVYLSHVKVEGKTYKAVTNVGVRPTFETQPVAPRVETHILDFDRLIYGENILVSFLALLRDEQRYPNPQALVFQINKDIAFARKYFSR